MAQNKRQEKLRCKYCGHTFQRKSHLERHSLRHSGVKSFTCRTCTKSFPRNDTLLRHEATHGQHDSQVGTNARVSRACLSCAQAKQRCYGGNPCARCGRKQSTCEYKRQNSSLSVLPTDNVRPNGDLSGDLAEQDTIVSNIPSPTAPGSASTSAEFNSRASITLPQDYLSEPTSVHDSLEEETNRTIWPDPLPIQGFISAVEPGLFANHIPYDMRRTDEISRTFAFPFAWMTESFESDLQIPHTMSQRILDHSASNQGSLAALETAGSADFLASEPASRIIGENGERRVRQGLDATHPSLADGCPCFPMLEKHELQGADSELFGYVNKIPEKAYDTLSAFYVSELGYDDMSFPHCRLLHAFVELYFEHFDPLLPFLHLTRLETDDLSWILLTAVAAVGSQYSEVRHASQFTAVLKHLLRRAIQTNNSQAISKSSKVSLVQSILLRDVGLTFSGLASDHTVVQHERNTLITLCRSLKTLTGFCGMVQSTVDPDGDNEWLAWLQEEEVVRLVHCIHILECLQLVFYDLRPLFRVTDFTHRFPCDRSIWRCRSANHWNEEKQRLNPDHRSQEPSSFSTRSSIMCLYADERATLDHMQSSKDLMSLIRPELRKGMGEQDTYSARKRLLCFGLSNESITLLDTLIDDAIHSKSFSGSGPDCSRESHLVHVIAMLREIPLRMIYASVGWQTSHTEMRRSRETLRRYLQRNQSTARTCLWHAAQIYSSSRIVPYPAYHASLSFAIAVSYILLYDQTIQSPALEREVLRLDKLVYGPGITAWTSCVKDPRVHITGIGILDSTGSSRRLLVDAEKALQSQRSWRSMAQSLARCFSQMSKGQVPSIEQR